LKAPEPHSLRGVFVEVDWVAGLSVGSRQLFESCIKELESTYLILSVSLNEAISLHNVWDDKSLEVVALSSAFWCPLAQSLAIILTSIASHCKTNRILPSCVPLDPNNFVSRRAKHLAQNASLLSDFVPLQRALLSTKVRTMTAILEDISAKFHGTTKDLLAQGKSSDSDLWTALDEAHFDLNTCLRETTVLLKCFLLVLPVEQLFDFRSALSRLPSKTLSQFRRTAALTFPSAPVPVEMRKNGHKLSA